MMGFAIHSRVESFAEEEATTFHINKSRCDFQRYLITKLKTNDNRTITNPEHINKEIIEQLSKIFQNQSPPYGPLAYNFFKWVRDALTRSKSTTNGPNSTIETQSVSSQTGYRQAPGSFPDDDNFLIAPF